ncbi:ABC transporter substrate-binding protein [Alphaproteobacteria bacterium]|nr:ABC transporter substrate-binding protein [Alphaproteobacteria bacterium]
MKKLIFTSILLLFTNNIYSLEKIKLSLDWVPQAEHGGFFQAIANDYYREVGLEVEIIPGGPQVNTKSMLMSGQVDFNIGGSAGALNYVKQDLPFTVVAAFFQKNPQILMSHPNQNIDDPSQFKGKTIFVSNFGRMSFWPFIKSQYDLSDDFLKNYNFNSQPFIEDKQSIQQGYLSSEPFAIKKTAGFSPVIHLLADHGYDAYANTIETSLSIIENNPKIVKSFIDASRKGWVSFLNDDPSPAFQLIKKLNPDMPDDKLVYARDMLISFNIIEIEGTKIGSMSDERWENFYTKSKKLGIYEQEIDYKKAYTLEFSN